MYDWSFSSRQAYVIRTRMFQLLLKGCTIEARKRSSSMLIPTVSVVVERMYDWSCLSLLTQFHQESFSCCWKDVRLKQSVSIVMRFSIRGFSCCWKDVRLKLNERNFALVEVSFSCCWKDVRLKLGRGSICSSPMAFQLLLKGCTIEAGQCIGCRLDRSRFSCCWKDVRLKHDIKHYTQSFRIRFSCCWKDVRLKLRNQLIENKWFLTVGFWSVFRKWSICTKSAIIFENLGWFGWLLDCFW